MRYFKLYKTFIKNCFIRDLEYEKSFFVYVIAGFVWVFINYLFFRVVFGGLNGIGDFNKNEVMFLFGVYSIISSLLSVIFSKNLNRMGEYVETGELDFVVTKPVNSQFFVTLRYADFTMAFEFFVGVLICLVAGSAIGIDFSLPMMTFLTVLIFASLLICYSWWLSIMCLTFYFEKANGLVDIFWELFHFSKFPDVYKGKTKTILAIFFPMIFGAYVPTAIYLQKIELKWGIGFILLSAILLFTSSLIWKKSLKRYASASS